MTARAPKPLFSSNHHFDILICLGLVLAIFIPYHQVAGHRFVEFDDGLYTFQNTYIIRGLTWDSVCWSFSNTEAANWHPLTWISYLVDRELFRSHPGAYLMENVAWHALASCLCYLAFLKTTKSRLFAFTVALILAVHPANVENVAWASERKSLLDAVFWFAAIITYLDFIETRSFRSYGFTAIAHMLGLMCKAMSVTLPFTLILVHLLYLVYHPDPRASSVRWPRRAGQILLPVIPLLFLSAYFSAVTIFAQSGAMPPDGYSFDMRIINTLLSFGRYLAMFFHPGGLAIFYPLFYADLNYASTIPSVLVLTAVSAAAVLLVRRKPQVLIGWCWFLGTLVPVIGLVQVGSQSHADRYLYIPMVGLAFVFPVLFEELRSIRIPWRRAIAGVSLVVLGTSMIAATRIQVSYWKDGVALFRHSLDITGDCVTSVMSLAVAYSRTDRFEELIAFADAKIAIAQNLGNKAKLARFKATGLYGLRKYEAAIASAQQAVDWGDTDSSTYWLLAVANYHLGRLDKAAQYITKAKASRNSVNKTILPDVVRDMNLNLLEQLVRNKIVPGPDALPPAAVGSAGTKPAN